jgi:FixJ family two-component response regulator
MADARWVETAATGSARVAVVEDDERVREALAFQLETAGVRAATYASAEEFLSTGNREVFDCVLSAIALAGMNGLQFQEKVKERSPFVSFVFISRYSDLWMVKRAMQQGAVDYLEKPVDDAALLASIKRGGQLTRERRIDDAHRAELEKQLGRLTPRERAAFPLIIAGLPNKQAASEMGIAERTIKAHRARVLEKMSVKSVADLVRMAQVLQIQPARSEFTRAKSLIGAPGISRGALTLGIGSPAGRAG